MVILIFGLLLVVYGFKVRFLSDVKNGVEALAGQAGAEDEEEEPESTLGRLWHRFLHFL